MDLSVNQTLRSEEPSTGPEKKDRDGGLPEKKDRSTEGGSSNSGVGHTFRSLMNRLSRREILIYFFGATASGLLFSTALLSVFSLVPLLILGAQTGALATVFGLVLNAMVVLLMSGKPMALAYLVWVLIPGLCLREGLARRASLQVNIVLGTLSFLCAAALALWLEALVHGISISAQFTSMQGMVVGWIEEGSKRVEIGSSVQGLDWEMAKERFLMELPSSILVAHLTMVTLSLLTVARFSPAVPPYQLRDWRMPSAAVWGVIVIGAGWLMTEDGSSEHTLFWNLLRVALAGYLLQGVAILMEVLNFWKLQGVLRWLAFGFAVTMMLPLVLGIGFFDQWFDFRAKIGQS